MAMSEGEGSRLQEQGLTLSRAQAAHGQAQTCAHRLECLSGTAEPSSTLQGLTGLWDLGNHGASSLENFSTDERNRNSLLVAIFMLYTIRKFSLLLLWAAVRCHSLESLWDTTGSPRSPWGQYVPHTSEELNPTAKIYFSFCKSNQKNQIIMIFSILVVLYFEEMLQWLFSIKFRNKTKPGSSRWDLLHQTNPNAPPPTKHRAMRFYSQWMIEFFHFSFCVKISPI